MMVTAHLLYQCISFERELVVVVQVRKLLLRHLDSTRTCDVVDSTLLKEVVECITLIIEPCAPNFATLIKKIDAE